MNLEGERLAREMVRRFDEHKLLRQFVLDNPREIAEARTLEFTINCDKLIEDLDRIRGWLLRLNM